MGNLYLQETVHSQAVAILAAWGMGEPEASETASIMVDADLAGVDSHGISMLPGYQQLVIDGALDLSAKPETLNETRSTAVIDGHRNLGHRTTAAAMKLAISKAESEGVGAVSVKRSRHFGAAGYYASLAAQAGLIGLVTTTTRTRAMVPTRGQRPMLGTNPIAFAAPSSDDSAFFVLDMSTTTVAVNKVKVYDYTKSELPSGWMVDSAGNSITDSSRGYSTLLAEVGGGLTPLGADATSSSHKGYGLAVMVQILAGALAGVSFDRTQEEAAHEGVGHFCLAIDPSCFGDQASFRESVTEIMDTLRSEPPTDPDRPVLVAGDLERSTRKRRRADGIPLSDGLVNALRDVCHSSGAEFLLGLGS